MKIAIVGGGIAGLAVGWRLAAAGADVDVLERGLAGSGSTWAAAGMLAPAAEASHGNDPHARLAREAREQWPSFARELEEASGIAIGFDVCGSLTVACDDERAAELSERGNFIRAYGEHAEYLSAETALAGEPMLARDIQGALFAADDAKVDNRVVMEALVRAFARAGGHLHENCNVCSVHVEADRAKGVITSDGTIAADCVIVAAGAWSSLLGGLADGTLPPIRPAKGQMVSLRVPQGAAMPRHLTWGDGIYVVSRGQVVLLGATVEDRGFDTSVTREARDQLLARATRILPALGTWSVAESWAGLRPRTPDANPVLGVTGVGGLYMATGQFRNGILFAPVVAEILCKLVLGQGAGELASSFDPRRFAKA